jgi:hypothetical protein
MGRLLVGVLAIALAVGAVIGAVKASDRKHDQQQRAELIKRMERYITLDARRRVAAHQMKGPIVRTECEPYQSDKSRYSCTAIQFESKLSYTGQTYIARVDFEHGRFRFRPYKIPLYLGI